MILAYKALDCRLYLHSNQHDTNKQNMTYSIDASSFKVFFASYPFCSIIFDQIMQPDQSFQTADTNCDVLTFLPPLLPQHPPQDSVSCRGQEVVHSS